MDGPTDHDRWVNDTLDIDPAQYPAPAASALSASAPAPTPTASAAPGGSGPAAPPQPNQNDAAKGREAAVVTRADAQAALQKFLVKAQVAQGTQSIRVTPAVRFAVEKIGAGDVALTMKLDGVLASTGFGAGPAQAAAMVAKVLPDALPASAIAHLATATADDAKPKPTGLVGKAGDAIKDKLNEIGKPDRQQDGDGSPDHKEMPPSSQPPPGPDPKGQKSGHTPDIPWDIPSKPPPKPQAPTDPQASDGAAVAAAIATIDDHALVPAALRGKPEADNYPSAQDAARDLANKMDAARKKNSESITFPLDMPYPTYDDSKAALDAMATVVQKIGAAMPDQGRPLRTVLVKMAPPQGRAGAGLQQNVSVRQ